MVRSAANQQADANRDDDAGPWGHDRQKAEAHEKSDQVLLMLSGKLSGTVGPETVDLKKATCS